MMKKIKVLHIIYSFGIGGLEKGITLLINHASPDIEHTILCLTESGKSETLLSSKVPIIEMNKKGGNSFAFILKLAKTIKNIDPDVVHTRNWAGVDGIIAARLAGVKNVVHGEHGWGMDDPDGLNRKRIKIRRWLSYAVKEFTAVSCQIKDWLENTIGVHAPVSQIYNGLEFTLYPQRDGAGKLRRDLGLEESTLLIGVVGRLDPIKDHAGMFKAFERVRETYPACHLVVIGDGPEMFKLKSLQSENIHMLGMRSDIPELLRDIDIFALSSLNEGISNTILEAMACGLPIVATAVGGTPELIQSGHNGFLVPARDYSAFSEAVNSYLSSPELRAEHGRRNREIIEERFSIESMVFGYEEIWRRASNIKLER